VGSETALTDAGRLERDDTAWDAFVAGMTTPAFTQTTAWAQVKRANGWIPARVVTPAPGGSGPVGAQILLRRAGRLPWTVGYAPRGPLAATLDEGAIAAFGAAARSRAAELGLAYLRIEPELEDEPGLRAVLAAGGWHPVRAPFQPAATRLIDLTRPEEALRADLRGKWRQYVNKASRAGIRVEAGGRDDLPDFYRLYGETARRAAFDVRREESYRAVWEAFAPTGQARLLFARGADGEPLAVLLLVACGRRLTELHGGMSLAGAESRANYLLKWEAIRRAREEGFAEYDLWGLSHPGIAHFKAGFGGREVRYVGAWDLVLDPLGRAAIEVGRRVAYRVARALAQMAPQR
jgi:lipid II:glycine glycyltransferase (peptidoglycan interpeptide bridge formation enzyme)